MTTVRTTSGFALGDTDTQTALRRVDGNYVKADGSVAHDISLVEVDPVVYLQTAGSAPTPYGDLATAFADAQTYGTTPVTLTLLDDVTVSETFDVTGDVSLNLGSHTVTFDPSFDAICFDVKSGASLLVTADDDGGVRSMGEKTGVLFETREGSKRLAFRGGRYESYGLVVDGNSVGDLEIRDGYFHSVAAPAILTGLNGQHVTGGHFVTDYVDDGMPYYAVVASGSTSVAPGYPHQGGAQYLYNTSTGTLTVNGGYFGGGFFSEASTNLVINGGVFEGYDYALWTYNTKSTLRGGRFVSHDGKNSAIYFGGEEYDCDLDGSHFYATATNEELTIQAAPGIWGSASHAPCDAKGNRVFDVYIATAPASVTTLTHVIDDARHGKATLDDIRRAVDAVLLK